LTRISTLIVDTISCDALYLFVLSRISTLIVEAINCDALSNSLFCRASRR